MVLFNFFSKKSTVSTFSNFSFLKVDMHSHLIPAIDDGSDSVDTSITLLRGLAELGYEKVITTPHIRPEHFPNSREIIEAGLAKVKAGAAAEGIELELGCAAEYFVTHEFSDKIEKGDLMTFSENKVLIEVSTFSPPPNLEDSIFKLKIKGYQPVLAHPERYVYFKDIENFRNFKDYGCLLQLNLLSLTGHYGKRVKELAFRLLKEDLVDLLGTDMHHVRHLESIKKMTANRSIMRLLSKKEFMNAML